MPGSFTLDNNDVPLVGPALPVGVYWYDGESGFTPLVNVRCLRIDNRAGEEPPTALFRYVQDQTLEYLLGWPSQFEQLWPIDAQGPYVVQPDDRIVVAYLNPDGSPGFLFDGFAAVPQVDASGDHQQAIFAAQSVAIRAADDVIHTRVQRDADNPTDTSGDSDLEIHAPCRFNPQGTRANGTVGYLANAANFSNWSAPEDAAEEPISVYPVFADPLLEERAVRDGTQYVESWYIASALFYLIAQPSPADEYVWWPDESYLTNLLQTLIPPPGDPIFDPATATTANCVIRDYDASGKTLSRVLAELLGYAGFHYAWALGTDGDVPQTYMNIFRVDGAATATPKLLYLDQYGAALNPANTNVGQLHLARDINGVVNAVRVETGPKEVEITVTCSPLFAPVPADAAPSASPTGGWNKFKRANLTGATADIQRRYRWFGGDECGDGHYNAVTDTWEIGALDLSPVWPNTVEDGKTYAVRYRPGKDTLVSTDDNGKPRRATLEVYLGASMSDPLIQTEPTNTGWYAISKGWELLDDRLGFRVTCEDPEQWHTGNPDPKAATLRLITWLANPNDPASKQLAFRLTTVIDADRRIKAVAPKRLASPTRFARWRSVDAADHFQHREVNPSSRYYQADAGDGTDPVVVRDDTKDALAHARQVQALGEMPSVAGSVQIPYITTYYQVGDRIQKISGREVNLQTNVGVSAGEAPVYPWVVGVSWSFEGERQGTTLQLSDLRAEAGNNAW